MELYNFYTAQEIMKKLLYYSTTHIPSGKANSIQQIKMCECLVKYGFSVTLLTKSKKPDTLNDNYGISTNINHISVKCNNFRYLGTFIFMIKSLFFLNKKYNIGYTRRIMLGFILKVISCDRLFIELHSPPEAVEKYLLKILLRYKKVDKIITITQSLKDEILYRYNTNNAEVIVAHSGTELNNYAITRNNFENNIFKVGYVGSLLKGKGMEVISSIVNRIEFAEFHVIGGSSDNILKWNNLLKDNKNIFFHGHIRHSEINKMIVEFDVLLLPNQKNVITNKKGTDIGSWTSPVKMFEYMASGVPIIASNISVLREVLKNKENALLCDPENPDEWVDAIHILKHNPKLRSKLAKKAFDEFENKYTLNKRVEIIFNNAL